MENREGKTRVRRMKKVRHPGIVDYCHEMALLRDRLGLYRTEREKK